MHHSQGSTLQCLIEKIVEFAGTGKHVNPQLAQDPSLGLGMYVFESPAHFEEVRQGLSIHIFVSMFVVVVLLLSSQAEDWE